MSGHFIIILAFTIIDLIRPNSTKTVRAFCHHGAGQIHALSTTLMPAVVDTKDPTAMEKDLLMHQTAAMAAWLKEQKLDKTCESFEKALRKELHLKYGADTQIPVQANGQWQWVPQETKDTGEEESSDNDEEESESEESSSSEDSSESSSEYETDSSEYETDSEAEVDSDSKSAVVAKKAGGKSDQMEQGAASSVVDETTSQGQPEGANPQSARSVPGRSVSFDESTPNEFFYSPVRKSEKSNAFWTKKELRDIKNEEAMERMASIMAGSVFNVPGLSS